MTNQPKSANHDYDDYDYATFWKGREYEDAADKIAVERLLKKTVGSHRRIVDIGSGGGRMIPLYDSLFQECVLVDPSRSQLDIAKEKFTHGSNLRFVQGTAERIPLPSQSADVVLCVRVFHYIAKPQSVFGEIKRILNPGGYFILEVPNKVHIKTRLKNIVRARDRKAYLAPVAINISSKRDDLFLNHHPHAIKRDLIAAGFSVIDTLSVSNLRNPYFKKYLPIKTLVSFESFLQPLLSRLSFGPSIYFLVKLQKRKLLI